MHDYHSSVVAHPQYPQDAYERACIPRSLPAGYGQSATLHADKYIAVSAQVVCIGERGNIPMVASRVSVVDYRGEKLIDTYVRPTQPVTDYRAQETGLEPKHFRDAPSFVNVQSQVAHLIKGKILVGYGLWYFLLVMGFSHPAIDTRDVALFLPFRKTLKSKKLVPLPDLVRYFMARQMGGTFEDPLEQTRAALDLFRSTEDVWEGIIADGSWPCDLPPSSFASCFT